MGPAPALGPLTRHVAIDAADADTSLVTDQEVDPASVFDAATLSRLRAVREHADPARMCVTNHDLG